MGHYSIQSKTSILFQVNYKSFSACLKDAVSQKINLKGAVLRFKNLSQTELDGGEFKNADFTGSNLTGANLSEANLNGAIFDNVTLYGACFACSLMKGCSFNYALFGGTDFYNATISRSIFNGKAWKDVNFNAARKMDECIFIEESSKHITSKPPLVISGTEVQKVAIFNLRTAA